MINHKTLSLYLIKLFLKQFFIISIVVIGMFFVANAFDILQNFKSINIPLSTFWKLVSFKIPFLFYEVSTIVSFASSLMFLRHIVRYNELVIILNSGVSIWKVLIIPAISIFLIGVIFLFTLSPIGTYGLQKYKVLEGKLNNTSPTNVTISQSGIFFFENFDTSNRIIHAKSINVSKKTLFGLTILEVDSHNNFTKRIDSPVSKIESGVFRLTNARINSLHSSKSLDKIEIPTNLSINNLVQKFSPPEMISIWRLNSVIQKLSKSGIAVLKYQLFYYKQLLKPLAMAIMSLVACWLLNSNAQNQLSWKILTLGLILGIFIYFSLEIGAHILGYNGISPLFATLCPMLFVLLISNFVILHFQES